MNQMEINLEEGLIIVLVGLAIVFLALLLLFVIFQYVIPRFLSIPFRKVTLSLRQDNEKKIEKNYDSAEEIAVVAAAVYLFLEEVHDQENAIITISKSVKDYSPWSSKIYATHNVLRRGR